jgi:site-specific recombinase XerD
MKTIEELTNQCVQYFELHHFSVDRVKMYKFLWLKKLKPYMVKQSIPYYDASVGEKFLRSTVTGNTISRYEDDIIRSIIFLNEFQENGTISSYHYKPLKRELSGQIGLAMEKFLLHLGSLRRTNKTISEYRLSLYRLLTYLESQQIQSIEEIKEVQIMTFLSTSTNNRVYVLSSIRFFLRYLYEEHLSAIDLSLSLQHLKYSRVEKLPSVYSKNEVLQIEASIQRSDATGKRNYAMMLLATRLGLRASDIANLSFGNLDWEQSAITLSQFKTGKEIKLPLLTDVGEALIDYLKYGRKDCESDKVFLFTSVPFSPMTNSSVSSAFGRIIEASRVDVRGRRHGAHAMRHSLACRFLENKEPMPVISEALGHRSTETTMSYLRIDTESLNQCALNVPPVSNNFYEQKGGIFYE